MLNQRDKMTHYVTYDHDYDSSTTVTNYRWNVAFATLSLTLSTLLDSSSFTTTSLFTRTDGNRPVIQSLSVKVKTIKDTTYKHTLIWFLGCGWMWAAWLLFTSLHVAASTLLTQHSAFSVVTARGLHTVHQSPSCRHLGHWWRCDGGMMLLFSGVF